MIKKQELKEFDYILMYSVLGHPVMLFKGFKTKSGAVAYIRKQVGVVEFTIMPKGGMFKYADFV